MKILCYGDVQATLSTEKLYRDPTVNLQDWRVRTFFERLVEFASEVKPDVIVDLGDLTDDRSSIPLPTLATVCSSLESLSEVKATKVKLIGNHEQWFRSTELDLSAFYARYFDVVVSDVSGLTFGDHRLVFASYMDDLATLEGMLASQVESARKNPKIKNLVLFGHFAASSSLIPGVSKQTLQLFDTVLLGHVHKHARVYAGHDIFYVGSPFQQDFGEAGQEKVVGVISPGSKPSCQFVPLTEDFPRYIKADYKSFTKHAKPDSEDRWNVALESQEEAQSFYVHPLCQRAEPDLKFVSKEIDVAQNAVRDDWTVDSGIEAWVSSCNPQSRSIISDIETVKLFGKRIAESV